MTKNFFGTPLIVSDHGAGLDQLTWYIHILMAALFVGWSLYFLYVSVIQTPQVGPSQIVMSITCFETS